MGQVKNVIMGLGLVVLLALWSLPASAQTPTLLGAFTGSAGACPGADPWGNLTLSGSTLYGMTWMGGANDQGTIFSIPTSGGTPTLLYSFSGASDGGNPRGSLTLSGSTLYGMTQAGGNNGNGVIFSLPTRGGTPTILFSFDNLHGGWPNGSLTLSGSTLYGMTSMGGDMEMGTIFSIPTTGGTPTILFSFDGEHGANPQGSLTLSGSTLYGMTSWGGSNAGMGTVFSIPTVGGTPTVLFSFDMEHGNNPQGDLTLSGSTLYGMTTMGGDIRDMFGNIMPGMGTIFSLPIIGGTPTVLFTFGSMSNSFGYGPDGSLAIIGSTLYGMTWNGGNQGGGAMGGGTIFSIPTWGGEPNLVFSFDNSHGAWPQGSLLLSGSTLYGMASQGGDVEDNPMGYGTIFSLPVQFAATVNQTPGGWISVSPSGPYRLGQTITVTATASSGHIFGGWSVLGASVLSNSASTTTLTVNGNFMVTALFKLYGTVWAWGDNSCGQLGDGTYVQRNIPVAVTGANFGPGYLTGVSALAAGYAHTLALNPDGTVLAWGDNEDGQLGMAPILLMNSVTLNFPAFVPGAKYGDQPLTGVTAVAAGYGHSVVLKSDGTVWGWGDNTCGDLGDNTTTERDYPVQVKLFGPGGVGHLTGITAVASGAWHSAALKSDGTVWTWGYNADGQLGDDSTAERNSPVQVQNGMKGMPGMSDSLSGVVALAAGCYHTVALTSSAFAWEEAPAPNAVLTWGDDTYGQLASQWLWYDTYNPYPGEACDANGMPFGSDPSMTSTVVAVASSWYHTLALMSDGTVWAWGYNGNGQLGNDTPPPMDGEPVRPVQVMGPSGSGSYLTGVVAIAAGYEHSVALKADGTVWAWGDNSCGQLGDGTTTSRLFPVQVLGSDGAPLSGITAIAAGGYHTVALATQCNVTCVASPPVGGSVTLSPSAGPYYGWQPVQLVAHPNPGYVFMGWVVSGLGTVQNALAETTTLTPNGDVVVTAEFGFVGMEQAVGGMIILTSSGPYTPGQVIAAVALANAGYVFTGWSVTGPSTLGSTSAVTTELTVNDNFTLTATFRLGTVKYTVTDLGLNWNTAEITGFNNAAQVAGTSFTSTGEQAFLYSGGQTTWLPTLGGPGGSFANGLNNAGQVVGWVCDPNWRYFACIWSSGTWTNLGCPLGGSWDSVAYCINNVGQVFGQSYTTGNAAYDFFLYRNGVATDLGTLGQGLWPSAMNDSAQVVGATYSMSGFTWINHACLYSNSVMNDLGTLGGPTSYAYGINNAGQVVGCADITASNVPSGDSAGHAFLYSSGSMADLGTLGGPGSLANDINNSGQIVGSSEVCAVNIFSGVMAGNVLSGVSAGNILSGGAAIRAFIYTNGVMADLNGLISPSTSCMLQEAMFNNDRGQIVCAGTNSAGQAGEVLLLTPINMRPLGDINNDGVVNGLDLTILNKRLNGCSIAPQTDADCDLNCNGRVTTADRVLLRKYLKGLGT